MKRLKLSIIHLYYGGKEKFNSLIIIIDSIAKSSIILRKHRPKLWKKNTKKVCWGTQVGDFNTSYKSKVEILIPDLDSTKSVTWNFHVGESQGTHRCDMIIGRDILS